MSQLEETVALINRGDCIEKNIDALGKRWVIKHINATALYLGRPDPDREDAIIPKEFRGKWTKPSDLQKQITLYLTRSWNKAELAQVKAERKASAPTAKETQSVDVFTEPSEEAQAEEDAAVAEMLAAEETDARTTETEGLPSTEQRA